MKTTTTIRKTLAVLLAAALLAAALGACTSPIDALRGLFSKKSEKDVPFKGLKLEDYVDPGDYKDIPKEPTAEALAEAAKSYFSYYGCALGVVDDPAKKAAAKGDFIVFDFEGTVEGASEDTLTGMKSERYFMQLGDSFIPGFEDQIVGHSRGEEFDVNVVFPEDYGKEELNGKPAVFKCKLYKIGAESKEEVMDEGVRRLTEGQMTAVAEFLEEIKPNVAPQCALDTAIEGAKYLKELPEKEADFYTRFYEKTAAENDQTLEEFLAANGYTDGLEKFKEEINDKQVRQDLFIYAVAAKEGIEVTDTDLQERLDSYRQQQGAAADTTDDAIYEQMGGRNYVLRNIMANKIAQFIYENAKDSPAAKTE